MKRVATWAVGLSLVGLLAGCESTNRASFDPTANQERQVFGQKSVYFDLGSTVLNDAAKKLVKSHAEYMERNSNVILTLRGSADAMVNNTKDLKLATARGQAVRAGLVALGVEPKRIEMTAALEINPKKQGLDPAKSRRVDFLYR